MEKIKRDQGEDALRMERKGRRVDGRKRGRREGGQVREKVEERD